jgi:hypothetical protein
MTDSWIGEMITAEARRTRRSRGVAGLTRANDRSGDAASTALLGVLCVSAVKSMVMTDSRLEEIRHGEDQPMPCRARQVARGRGSC